MKKKLFRTVVAGATILLSLTGCRPETTDEVPFHPKEEPQLSIFGQDPQDWPNSELLWNLQQINQELKSETMLTKSFCSNFLNIAKEDIVGAYQGGRVGSQIGRTIGNWFGNSLAGAIIGGILGGVGYGALQSYLAANQDEPTPAYEDILDIYDEIVNCLDEEGDWVEIDSVEYQSIVPNEALLEHVQLNQTALRVGLMHNLMLATMDSRLPWNRTPSTRSDEEGPIDEPEDTEELEEAIRNSNEMAMLLGNNYVFSDEAEESLSTMVMDLFDEVFLLYPTNLDDVVFIVNRYMEIVDNSNELTDDEKDWIRMGLAVSIYSFHYWWEQPDNNAE
ncbi:MAG: hypothetical protein IJ611_09185 [Bacteroidales bacterium]|nr:hypothetical protein [Bacteroidales bacterium]